MHTTCQLLAYSEHQAVSHWGNIENISREQPQMLLLNVDEIWRINRDFFKV